MRFDFDDEAFALRCLWSTRSSYAWRYGSTAPSTMKSGGMVVAQKLGTAFAYGGVVQGERHGALKYKSTTTGQHLLHCFTARAKQAW